MWHEGYLVDEGSVGTGLCYNLIGSQKLISELLGRMGSVEKVCLDIGLTSEWEVWGWSPDIY